HGLRLALRRDAGGAEVCSRVAREPFNDVELSRVLGKFDSRELGDRRVTRRVGGERFQCRLRGLAGAGPPGPVGGAGEGPLAADFEIDPGALTLVAELSRRSFLVGRARCRGARSCGAAGVLSRFAGCRFAGLVSRVLVGTTCPRSVRSGGSVVLGRFLGRALTSLVGGGLVGGCGGGRGGGGECGACRGGRRAGGHGG